MADYNWCHSPDCHTKHTQDRIRGVKGNKVLRTRKVKVSNYLGPQSSWNYFCSHHCQQDFWNTYGNEIRAIAPRNEPLETPIDVVKSKEINWRGEEYTATEIREIQPQGGNT
jgi:hypothetical protein